VGLVYSTFFFLPARRLMPADALLHNVSVSDAQSILLLAAAIVRLQFARVSGSRHLLLRLALFLLELRLNCAASASYAQVRIRVAGQEWR
jgi:hypothetical protein